MSEKELLERLKYDPLPDPDPRFKQRLKEKFLRESKRILNKYKWAIPTNKPQVWHDRVQNFQRNKSTELLPI